MGVETIDRLIELIATENELLKTGGLSDHERLSVEKARCLMELSAIHRDGIEPSVLRPRADRLRGLLTENARLLKAHMRATEKLAESITSDLRAETSDGTYGRHGGYTS